MKGLNEAARKSTKISSPSGRRDPDVPILKQAEAEYARLR